MRIRFSEDHRRHFPQAELTGGEFVTPFERPSRVERILAEARERGFTDIADPGPAGMAPIQAVHDAGYLAFLESIWEEWVAAGNRGEVIAQGLPTRRMRADRIPRGLDGRVGWYAHAAETAICEGTWAAALSAAASAQAATRDVTAGAPAAFALCRPPGHHATADQYGGYSFLNNAAIAARMLQADGAAKVAVLDIDFHHGNGTQSILYEDPDILFASIHGDPMDAYPWYLGHADETGAGPGEGATINYPLPPGTAWDGWSVALDDALARIAAHGAEALVVSLGTDAYKDDPISFFRLESDDFTEAGRRIAALRKPTVFVMEGGYAVGAIGVNTINTLAGFEDG